MGIESRGVSHGRVAGFLLSLRESAGLRVGLLLLVVAGLCCLSVSRIEAKEAAAATAKWEAISTPNTDGGLVMCPRFLSLGKLLMAWGWKGKKLEETEYTFSNFSGDSWSEPVLPFFGKNVGNVRRLAMTTAKSVVGIIYQRTMEQDATAFEVLYSVSNDRGWSYSTPKTADSYVNEREGGTAVNIAGVAGRKPALTFGWLAENRTVKAALFDPLFIGDRPRSCNLGHYAAGCERIELSGEDDSGFVVVWNEGPKLMSAHIKPLVGESELSQDVVVSKVGLNFALTNVGGRNCTLVYDLGRAKRGECRRQVRVWKDRAWQPVAAAAPSSGDFPVSLRMEATQDKDRGLHVASLSRDGESITYSRLVNGRFTEPEVAMALKPVLGITGMDIAVCDGYVYIVASQGPYFQVARRSLK